MKIQEAVAVVTGAASGIGQAVSTELAQRGAKAVALVDQSSAVEATSEAINKTVNRGVARAYAGNVTDPKFRHHVFADLHDQLGW